MPAEAYKKGDIVAVVHRREGGRVYGHTQDAASGTVYLSDLFKMDEAEFERAVSGTRVVDLKELPAWQSAPSR